MKWFNSNKSKKQLTYQFLCKRCDFFFYRKDPDDCRCPNCGTPGEVYEVYEGEFQGTGGGKF